MPKKPGALWRARPFMSQNIALLYYKTVVLPDILYAATSFYPLWSTTSARPLQILSKKSVRCIMNVAPSGHTAPLFVELDLHDFRQHVEKEVSSIDV